MTDSVKMLHQQVKNIFISDAQIDEIWLILTNVEKIVIAFLNRNV